MSPRDVEPRSEKLVKVDWGSRGSGELRRGGGLIMRSGTDVRGVAVRSGYVGCAARICGDWRAGGPSDDRNGSGVRRGDSWAETG